MYKKFISMIFVLVSWAYLSTAQPSGSLEITNWGASIFGVQMSISLSTNVIKIGSETKLQCHIKNSSTNCIYAIISDHNITANLFLTNNLGKCYNLTPPRKFTVPQPVTVPPSPIGYFYDTVNAGEIHTWSVPLKINQDIGPGEYQLKAERFFLFILDFKKDTHKLVSNSLEIKVIK